jgi:hypothetical protein
MIWGNEAKLKFTRNVAMQDTAVCLVRTTCRFILIEHEVPDYLALEP